MKAGTARQALVTIRLDRAGFGSAAAAALGYGVHATAGTLLYRFHDSAGRLLYVGVTNRPAERWGRHRRSAAWWSTATFVTIQRFCAEWLALDAERAAIHSERPAHNRRSVAP